MSESKQKLKRKVSALLREQRIKYFPEASYPNAAKQARLGGSRQKGTGIRTQSRTASGMIYYMPNVGTEVEGRPDWKSNRIYLLYFGESVDDVKVSLAELTMFNHTGRKDLLVVYCRGERP